MKGKIAKLIDVKSLVTLSFTLSYLTMAFIAMIMKIEIPEGVHNIYLLIIAFYFGTQVAKNT